MAVHSFRRLARVLISIGTVWVALVAVGALAIVISARGAESFHVEGPVPLLVEEPRDVPRAAAAASQESALLQELPTVNGLFFGDGDYQRYGPPVVQDPYGKASLYYTRTAENHVIAALVLDQAMNDNVFGDTGDVHDKLYVQDAGWAGTGSHHRADALIQSDHAVWNLFCGIYYYTWQQDYVYTTTAGWMSDPDGPDGTPAPVGVFITSASSLQYNLNNRLWDVTLGGTRTKPTVWKSVATTGAADETVQDEGWPTYNSTYDWEWPLVYECELDISVCGPLPFTLWPVTGHNSPPKEGTVPDIPFYDWGDLPDTYATISDTLGPTHKLTTTMYMGVIVDPEADGQPSVDADGDDTNPAIASDDEDGVVIGDLVTTAGSPAQVRVYATNQTITDAVVYGFIDWNGDGDFLDTNETASVDVPAGTPTNTWFLLEFGIVPDDVVTTGSIYSRFRLSTDPAAALPTGVAWDGEVEDYEIVPTLAIVRDFSAYENRGRVVVQWSTAAEIRTVGFHLLRLDQSTGEYVQLNEALLPGLLGSPQGGTYRYVDETATPGGSYTYMLVEVESSGLERSYGPFTVEAVGTGEPMLSNYTATARAVGAEKRARIDARAVARETAEAQTEERVGSKLKIAATEAGLYYLDASQIAALAGVPSKLVAKGIQRGLLQLKSQGQKVAYLAADGGSGIYFYGEGVDSIYTDENIYWLKKGKGLGMQVVEGRGPLPASAQQTFVETVHVEEDRWAQTGQFTDPHADYWLWEMVVSGVAGWDTKSFVLGADGAARTGTAAVTLHLHGTQDAADCQVAVSLNGSDIGGASWDGAGVYDLVLPFDPEYLSDGDNILRVTAVDGAFWVDSFDLTYERYYRAVDNWLLLRGGGNPVVTVAGFSNPDIWVFNVADAMRPARILATTVDQADGIYRVSFEPSSPDAPYLALSVDAASTPKSVVADVPSELKSTANAADYLVVTQIELKEAAHTLVDYRRSLGLGAILVDLEDIYDEFNYGIDSPEAIKAFLTYAYHNWAQAPTYVVLAGEGTYDYKDNRGYGDNLIPALMVSTPHGLFASDNRFVDVAGDDGVPEMAIGRLPVMTAEELQALVAKIVAYEGASGGPWAKRVIMLADDPDSGGDFPADSDDLAALLPADYTPIRVYLSGLTIGEARQQVTSGINSGAVLLNYFGHAGWDALAHERLLGLPEVELLYNGEALPVATLMTCLAGRFSIPGYDAIGEELVRRDGGGAVAVWAPTGLSLNAQARILDEAFFNATFQQGERILGQAVLSALREYASHGKEIYLLDIYNLLGDPALEMK